MKNSTQITFAFQDPPDSGENPGVGVRIKSLKKAAAEVSKDEQEKIREEKTREEKSRQANSKDEKTIQDQDRDEKAIQDNSIEEKAIHANSIEEKNIQDNSIEAKTIQDKHREGQTSQYLTTQDNTRIAEAQIVSAIDSLQNNLDPLSNHDERSVENASDEPVFFESKREDSVADADGTTRGDGITRFDGSTQNTSDEFVESSGLPDFNTTTDGSPADLTVDQDANGVKATKSTRGRKSLKTIDEGAELINIPPDEILFQKQYYAIGEVAEMFHVNQSLLRFWETEFDIIQPRKNRKGDRHFRPIDIKNLLLIHDLLRRRKLTIEGAKDFLKKNKRSPERFAMIQSLQKIKGFILEIKATL